jgi:CheY-like chemotaxis protein
MSEPRRRVLIVDDEPDLVDMLALRLEATGLFEVERAHDGPTGLACAHDHRPDVVLLDNIMPGMDGWEVCRRLREDPESRDVPVVIMTAGAPKESQRLAREVAADALILKPYDQSEVIQTLKTVRHAVP